MAHVTLTLAGAVTLVTLAAALTPADVCHGLNCPHWTVLNATKDWELRRVNATKWVATNTTGMTYDPVHTSMFWKLFSYIDGKNANTEKIAMTAPVLTTVVHGPGPNCKSTFEMKFMLPYKYWSAPVAPSDPSVYITELPAMDVFVRTFGGFPQDADYTTNLHQLSSDIATTSAVVETRYFFQAGYDGPYTFVGRHNEIWIKKL